MAGYQPTKCAQQVIYCILRNTHKPQAMREIKKEIRITLVKAVQICTTFPKDNLAICIHNVYKITLLKQHMTNWVISKILYEENNWKKA